MVRLYGWSTTLGPRRVGRPFAFSGSKIDKNFFVSGIGIIDLVVVNPELGSYDVLKRDGPSWIAARLPGIIYRK